MRIAVIGAGAIGGTMATLLDKGGHELEVTARGAHAEAIRSHGLRLAGGWGEHSAHPRVSETLQRRPDIAIVATKAMDAPAALRASAPQLAGVPVLVVQNGLDGLDSARVALPDSPLAGALAVFAASLSEPGLVTVTTAGDTVIGDGATASPTAQEFARVLSAVMPARTIDNFIGAQWTKLVINHVNALPAITGLSVQETLAEPRLRRLITLSMREAIRVARALGVRFAPLQGLQDWQLSLVQRAPLALAAQLPALMGRRMGPVPNPGSTLQSIRRGVPTEIDALNGVVVARGLAAGVPTPVSRRLVELVHRVEADGAFLSVEETERAALS